MVVMVLISLAVLLFYMHQEQQDLRSRLNQLAREQTAPLHFLEGSEKFLEMRDGFPGDAEEAREANQEGSQKDWVEEVYPGHLHRYDISNGEGKRRLGAMYSVGTAAGVGCYQLTNQATETYGVSSATACNSNICPDCFITPGTVSQDIALTIQSCSSAKWARSAARSGIWAYTFINTDATQTLSVTDNSGSGITFKVPPNSHVMAWCAASQGTSHKLVFMSTTLPTLTVDSGLTLSAGNFDASASTGTFQTSSGAVTINGDTTISGAKTFATGTGTVGLNGAVTVADSTALTVGSAGAGGVTTLYGNVVIGNTGSGNGASLTLNGNFAQNDVTGAAATFATGTSPIALNADVTVASGKNLHMTNTGAGTFQTGTGTVTLNGATTVSGSNTFTSGTGAVALNGNVAVADSTTVTVGSAGAGGATTLYGNLVVGSTASGGGATTTVNGNFAQGDVTGAAVSTFATGTGAISLNGDVTVATGKDLHMTAGGAGTFQTGTGTVTLNGATTVSGTNTFTTGTGNVALNGDVAVADSKTVTVGSAGAGGATTLYGNLVVGSTASGGGATTTVNGNFAQGDVTGAAVSTFATGTGAISLNGDVTVATGKNLHMTAGGAGTFQTGTGTVTLNGATTISGSNTFATGTGTVGLNGAVTVADSTALTVGSAGAGGVTTLYGNVVIGNTGSGNGASLTLNGNFAQADVTGAAATFATGTSSIALNGDVTVAANKNLHMTYTGADTGTFQTGSGTVTLNGATTISGASTFATGTGAVTLNGDTTVSGAKTFSTGTGNVGLNGAVTVAASQAFTLTDYTNAIVCTHGDNEGGSTYCRASR